MEVDHPRNNPPTPGASSIIATNFALSSLTDSPTEYFASPVVALSGRSRTIRVRRPFKYLKHQGPRPKPQPNKALIGLKPLGVLREGWRDINKDDHLVIAPRSGGSSSAGRASEKPYNPSISRLLRSRNLNLSALDISACKSKTPSIEVLRDELDSLINSADIRSSARPSTARLAQARMSCFSDWSASTTTPRRLSYSVFNNNLSKTSPSDISRPKFPTGALSHGKRRSETYEPVPGQLGSRISFDGSRILDTRGRSRSDVYKLNENLQL